MLPEILVTARQLAEENLSLIAGSLVGAAGYYWWINAVHDSVQRFSVVNRDDPQGMRMHFAAVVNRRDRPLDEYGDPRSPIIVQGIFYGTVLLLVFLVGWATKEAAAVLGFLGELPNLWRYAEVAVALLLYLVLWLKLRARRHRTVLILWEKSGETVRGVDAARRRKDDDDRTRWTRLTGERAEDGLPTRDLDEEEHRGDPGFWRRHLLG